jgi:ribonuclease HII
MEEYAVQFPAYNWQKNKGYPTKEHRNAILIHGTTDLHRKTFTLLSPEQLRLF